MLLSFQKVGSLEDFQVNESSTHYLNSLKDHMTFRLDYLKEFQ